MLAVLAAVACAAPARAQSDWPRQFTSSSGTFVIYQPQPEDLEGDVLNARAAFSVQKTPDAAPVFGVLWMTMQVQVDRDSSVASESDLDVTRVRMPQITSAEARSYERLVENEAAGWDLSLSVEELRSGLAAAEKERASVEDLNNAPPHIVVSERRAILVVYDGPPVLEPIEGTNLQYVANTPYAVVYDPSRRTYYLTGAQLWYSARDPLGPWSEIGDPPSAVRRAVPPDTSRADLIEGPAPRIITATEPSELIASDGPLAWAPLVEDELLYATNTENDVLRQVSTQRIYVLLAGRWYTARTLGGPWTYVRGDELPAVFQRIPADSPKGHLLASVAGTEQADDAIADAEIPQTSAVRRDAGGFEVSYDGEPDFEPIEGTQLRYAVNCDAEVILADGRYYACDQGVWYIADSPDGPWAVSETRPIGIDDIPPSCPVYDTRYCEIYSVTPEVVYVGYLPGYIGCYPYYGTVVYGTGWHYRPWHRRRYFPRRWTWGFYARYNPWLARWGFGHTWCSGFLRTGSRWRPGGIDIERRARPQWFGPGGYRRPLAAPGGGMLRTTPRRAARQRLTDLPANLYNRQDNIARVDRQAIRLPVLPIAPASRANDVFAGKDGKVYQRDPNGNWRVRSGSVWKPTPAPMPVLPTTPPAGTAPKRPWPGVRPLPRVT
ncbi:MAG TPA: carbohydrate-binding family V/XII, partial [Candidatus Eisenbacteria bacterium]|nr:carbohydrate-binding family V/XII [Candidatus Eisenbacteria bacterium]